MRMHERAEPTEAPRRTPRKTPLKAIATNDGYVAEKGLEIAKRLTREYGNEYIQRLPIRRTRPI